MMVMMVSVPGTQQNIEIIFTKFLTCGHGHVPLYVCVYAPRSDCAGRQTVKTENLNISQKIIDSD